MKLCINCAHFSKRMTSTDGEPFVVELLCSAMDGRHSAIDGQIMDAAEASLMRCTLCGWHEAKLFQPKET